MRNLKLFLTVLSIVFLSSYAKAQITVQDTVCNGATGVKYWVTNTSGSTYNWTLTGGGTIASGQNTDTIVINWAATNGTDTLKVVETNSDLCIGEPISLAITRVAAPVANAGLNASIGACLSQSTTLDASGSTGSGVLTYSWSPSSGLSATNIYNPIASPSATTTYTVTVTSSHGCSSTDDVIVTVDAAPVAATAATTTIGGCVGQSALLDGTTSTGTSISHSWTSTPAGFTSIASTATVTPTVTTTYTLTVTDVYGCTDTENQIVNVASAPIAIATTNKDTIGNCALQSANISGTTSTGVSLDYSWSSTPSGFTSSNGAETVSPTVTTTYTLLVTDDYGCTSTDNVTITVDAAPVADAGSATSLCLGNSTSLNSSASTGSSLGFSWSSNPSGFTSSTPNPLVTPSSTTTYTLLITDKNGCTSTDDVVVTIFPAATASTGTISAICQGSDASLLGSGANYSSILWSTSGDGSFLNGTTLTPTYTPGVNDITNGTVNITITVQGTGPCPIATETKSLIINPKPSTSPIFHF